MWADYMNCSGAGTVILKVVYGYQTRTEGKDPLVKLAGDTMVNFAEACVPGKFLVDVLPFCRCSQPGHYLY